MTFSLQQSDIDGDRSRSLCTLHCAQRGQAQALAEAAQRAAQAQVDVVLDRPVGQVIPQPCTDWRQQVLLLGAGILNTLATPQVGDRQRLQSSSNSGQPAAVCMLIYYTKML